MSKHVKIEKKVGLVQKIYIFAPLATNNVARCQGKIAKTARLNASRYHESRPYK